MLRWPWACFIGGWLAMELMWLLGMMDHSLIGALMCMTRCMALRCWVGRKIRTWPLCLPLSCLGKANLQCFVLAPVQLAIVPVFCLFLVCLHTTVSSACSVSRSAPDCACITGIGA